MKIVKMRNKVKGVKVLDKPANLSKRMKNSFVRTKEQAEETRESRHMHMSASARANKK